MLCMLQKYYKSGSSLIVVVNAEMHHTVPWWFKFMFTLPFSLHKGTLFIVQGLPVKDFPKQASGCEESSTLI